MRSDLPVQHLRGDVGVVGSDLSHPSPPSSVRTRTNATHSFAQVSMAEIRTGQSTTTFRIALPPLMAAMASLIPSSG